MSPVSRRLRLAFTFVIAVVSGCAFARPAFAQAEPRMTVAGAYAFLQQQTAGDLNATPYAIGWAGAFTHRMGGSRWSAAGELSMNFRINEFEDFDETQTLLSGLGGARYALFKNNRITLFAQTLAGFERFSEPGFSEIGPAVQPGGGLDLYVSPTVFIRVQGDYRWSQANDATYHAYRIVAGMGVAIGR